MNTAKCFALIEWLMALFSACMGIVFLLECPYPLISYVFSAFLFIVSAAGIIIGMWMWRYSE